MHFDIVLPSLVPRPQPVPDVSRPLTLLAASPRARGSRCCDRQARPAVSATAAGQLAEDMALLGHPVRLQLLDVLARNEGRVCVCDLEAAVPVKQPTVSHHLKILREAGIVGSEKQGLWAFYFVNRPALDAVRGRIAERLDALG
jgi:ArsR family transcriptional regulator, arsenate/arsenite/antimonite-responsive transcriptional repressor